VARYTGPKHKLCKAEGVALCGLPKCPVIRKNAGPPGQHSQKRRKKQSDYAGQLREKQKVKRLYGVFEKQFKRYYDLASRKKAATGEALLQLLESRLDNIIYRLNIAESRPQARQLVSHGHITIDNKKVTIPSYNVKIGDVISLSKNASNFNFITKLSEESKDKKVPSWLEKKATVGKVKALPSREDIDIDINERLIVEYYSR
jgi:small subunit ribosomal protein S4